MAIDDGLLSNASWIKDAPTRFGSYQPENFNRRYYGDVRIHEALRHSLNVPAVAIMDKIGGQRFEASLKNANMNIVRLGGDSERAGLAVALGGAGITLNDLAVGYAALANGGEARPLRWIEDEPFTKPVRLFQPDTAADLTDILRQAPTPAGHVPGWLAEDAAPIAYKTGTSYGFRDAWAAGYTDRWTIIVWTGRPDGAPCEGQTGRIAAAPLLFDLFAALPVSRTAETFAADDEAPLGLQRVKDYTEAGPQILFPPDDIELIANEFGPDSRGFTLSARTETGKADFFVNGERVPQNGGQSVWRPKTPGFYRVSAVDEQGRETISDISVLSMNQLADPRF